MGSYDTLIQLCDGLSSYIIIITVRTTSNEKK